jgi:transcriptional regulator with XRE-family HTH domain
MKQYNTKGLDNEQRANVAGLMKEIVEHRFGGSQRRMAEHCHLAQPYISDIIYQRRGVGAKTLVLLAEILECDISDILSGRMKPEMVASGAKPGPKAKTESMRQRTELERAVDFLRGGDLPDEYLDEVVATKFWGNYDYDRKILVPMIEKRYDRWVLGDTAKVASK